MTARALLALSLLLMAGCSHPPLLSLAQRVCDAAPQLIPGNEVSFGRSGGKTVVVNAASPCIDTPAGRASYVVFALPATNDPYQITVRSSLHGTALIWPNSIIYGADDRVRLNIRDFRGAASNLVASARGEPGDRYVVVTSTPGTIGRPYDLPTALKLSPVRLAAAVYVPIILPATPVGPMTDRVPAILAHSGTITVSAMPFVTIP
jgi:hypothetical protein